MKIVRFLIQDDIKSNFENWIEVLKMLYLEFCGYMQAYHAPKWIRVRPIIAISYLVKVFWHKYQIPLNFL